MVMRSAALLAFLFCSSFWCTAASAQIEVSSRIDPTDGSLDDLFMFSITVNGTQNAPAPLLTGGDQFTLELLGPQTSVSIVNGAISASVTYLYQLTPKEAGDLETPAVELVIGGKRFEVPPKKVVVSQKGAGRAAKAGDAVFLRQTTSKPSVYIGEQVVNSVHLYTRVDLREPKLADVDNDGFAELGFGEEQRTAKNIDGQQYTVVQLKKALFPLRSGKLTLPERNLTTHVLDRVPRRRGPFDFGPFGDDFFDDMFNRGTFRPVTLVSNPVQLEVKPLPPAPLDLPPNPAPYFIVGETQMKLSYEPDSIKVGEGKSVTVHVISTGNLNPLKQLGVEGNASIKVYEEEPEINYDTAGSILVSRKRFQLSLVPLRGGLVRLDGLRLPYFNPQSGKFEVATTPSIAFPVEGPVGATPEPVLTAAPDATADGSPTEAEDTTLQYSEPGVVARLAKTLSVGSALFVTALVFGLALLIYLWKRRPRPYIPPDLSAMNDPHEIEAAVRAALSERLRSDVNEMHRDALIKLLAEKYPSSNVSLTATSFFDHMAKALYSREKEADVGRLRAEAAVLLGLMGGNR